MAWIRERPTGLVYHDNQLAEPGFALVPQAHRVALIDQAGQPAHEWPLAQVASARLADDGTLIALMAGDPHTPARIANGEIEGIVELAPDGEVIWEYRGDLLHHDARRLPDGRYHALGFYPLSPEQTQAVQGGSPHREDPKEMWADTIELIGRDGQRETLWRAGDHLDPATQKICPLDKRQEWTHGNSIRILPNGNWLLSLRLTNMVIQVDHQSGEVLWEWGAHTLSHQHDARLLNNGNILIFDNGIHRKRTPSFARVIEVDPKTEKVVWQYTDKTILAFQSFMAGSAQRLQNGNTFITEAATGRLFQVTPEGETVWEWVNPVLAESQFGPTPTVYRSTWYGLDDPRLPAGLAQ